MTSVVVVVIVVEVLVVVIPRIRCAGLFLLAHQHTFDCCCY
jgi:hypothetical protein